MSRRSDHAHGELADAVDAALQPVAALHGADAGGRAREDQIAGLEGEQAGEMADDLRDLPDELDRKSTRLNSSHLGISYAVFCLKKKKQNQQDQRQVVKLGSVKKCRGYYATHNHTHPPW